MSTSLPFISPSYTKNLVSVIIPAFNREKLIDEAILSVHKQSYRPIECIIVDDGSTDGTAILLEKFKHKFDADDFTIIYLFQNNSGAPAARNNGIKNSKGEYIQFLDSDDLLYPSKIEDQVLLMQTHTNIDGVYGDWNHGTIDQNVLIKGEKWEDTISQFYGGRVIHTLSFLFRRQMVELIGPWDENLKRNQEVDFHLRGALAGGAFEYLAHPTGLWREHEGERIVTSNGAIRAIEFHEKWIIEFEKLMLLTPKRKKTAASFLFWHAMELDKKFKNQAESTLIKAYHLYPDFPEFNTKKMKLLRGIFGTKRSIQLWYGYSGVIRKRIDQNKRN